MNSSEISSMNMNRGTWTLIVSRSVSDEIIDAYRHAILVLYSPTSPIELPTSVLLAS